MAAAEIAVDTRLKQAFREQGRDVASFNGALLAEPWQVQSRAGGAFKVFTPFWRALREQIEPSPPLPAPERLTCAAWPADAPSPVARETTRVSRRESRIGPRTFPTPTRARRERKDGCVTFSTTSSMVTQPTATGSICEATSGLSAHLHFGEISPRQIRARCGGGARRGQIPFRTRLAGVLAIICSMRARTCRGAQFNPRFEAFPYRRDEAADRTSTPGGAAAPAIRWSTPRMRELWTTGFMHNRARMVVASFLTKHLLIDWREGEKWFWDTLADADEANNSASWQWVAGCGADAAPYFRIFNPVLQGEKFDPEGAYVRRYCPELARLPASHIHKPWAAAPSMLAAAGVRLGETWPAPIVDHDFARRRALAALGSLAD